MSRKMQLKIDFENVQDIVHLTYKQKMLVREAIEETLNFEQFQNPCEVSVTFTDNVGIRALNLKYRNIDKETDVLSFPLTDYDATEEPAVNEEMVQLGDVVLSLEQAVKQAEEYGHSVEREIAFLCVHSVLHLLGYDHVTSEEDDKDMRGRQSAIMDLMGLSVK